MKNKRCFSLGLLFFFSCFLFAQSKYDTDQKIPSELLKQDLATLKENLELVHTGLYVYTSKPKLDQFFKNIEAKLNEPKTDIEFYRLLTPLLPLIGNGHTNIIPSLEYNNMIRNEWPLFPFDLYWDAGKLYIYRNLSDDKTLVPGSVVQKVNGEDANAIIEQFAKNTTRDGYNMTGPMDEASNRFKLFYIQLKGILEEFEIEAITPDGQIIKSVVTAKTNAENKASRDANYGPFTPSFWSSDQPALELDIDGNIATMTIRTFAKNFVKKEKKQKFKKFYKASFEKIEAAGVKHLILDLRNNGGGDPMPTIELFAHLHPEPFTFYADVYSLVQRIPNKKLYTDFDFFTKTMHPVIFKKKGDFYRPNWIGRMAGIKGLKESKPNKPYYDQKVYVLTNSSSFSATGETTGIIKNFNRAIFIGEEAGGNPYQNTSGLTQTMELPNSKIRVAMPFWVWIMNVDFKNDGHGVIPDHIVRPSIQDMIDKKDRVMIYTLDLIKNE